MLWFVYAVTGAFLGSLSAITEKEILRRIHTSEFSVAFSVLAAVLTSPYLFFGSGEPLPPVVLLFIVGNAGMVAVAFFLVARAIRHLDISAVSPILLLSPFMTAVLAFTILGESLSVVQVGGMAAILIGLYVLETKSLRGWRVFATSLVKDSYAQLAIAGTFLYGCGAVMDRIVLHGYGVAPLRYIALIQVFLAVMYVAWFVYERRGARLSPAFTWREWVLVGVVAVLASSYRSLEAAAVAIAPSVALVSAIKRSSALFTTVVGGRMFHDDGLTRRVIACVIMVAGVYFVTVG